MVLIGISGKIGCGKDTACETFIRYGYTKKSFAEPLKKIGVALGFSYQDLYGTQMEKSKVNPDWGVSGRYFMQHFATELCRERYKEALPEMDLAERTLFVRIMEIYLNNNPDKNVIISDVRFLDEARLIKEHGGIIIRIVNNDVPGDYHKSETECDRITPDITISNNGDLTTFHNKVLNVYNQIHDTNYTNEVEEIRHFEDVFGR